MSGPSSVSGSLAAQPNITPLIDVLLVLLIIFMVITPSAMQGLPAEMPSPSPSLVTAREQTAIRIEILGGQRPSASPIYRVDGRVLGKAAFQSELLRLHTLHPFATVWLRGDPALSYQEIAGAIGAARAAGYSSVALLPRP